MTKKKALEVTTKGWKEDDVQSPKTKINSLNYRWEAKVQTPDGKEKFCYAYTKVDLEIVVRQQGYKILKVRKL